jgi:hypothetical protein
LVWEYVLSEEKQFGAAEPILFEDGETSLLLGNNELIKLSKEGDIVWSWIKPE